MTFKNTKGRTLPVLVNMAKRMLKNQNIGSVIDFIDARGYKVSIEKIK